MKQFYLLPNMITAFGLSCGLFVIFKTNMIHPGGETYELLRSAVLLLLLAAVADLLDGAIARVIDAESEFGSMFDSLADAITFGVAPSVLLLKSLSLHPATGMSFFSVVGAMLYTMCGVLRLVRFNVQTSKEVVCKWKYPHFIGLPIPAAAATAIALTLFLQSPFGNQWMPLSHNIYVIVLVSAMFVLGYLMVSKWVFPSFKAQQLKIPSFGFIVCMVCVVIFILFGVIYFLPVFLILATLSYILTGTGITFFQWLSRRKNQNTGNSHK